MLKNKRDANFRMVIAFFLMLIAFSGHAQDKDAETMAKADTTNFRVNRPGGWSLYNSYVSHDAADSISFEVIVRHGRGDINWKSPQLIGEITAKALLPKRDQRMPYFLLNDGYSVQVTAQGKCYLSLEKGSLPPTDPVIIPVQIKYSWK